MDDLDSHRRFAAKESIPYPLLADTRGGLAALYGVDTSRGVARRVTFLIGPDGVIRDTWPQVKVDGHAGEVLAAVRRVRAR